MSKIYEALRQAELDRTRSTVRKSDPIKITSAAQAVLDPPAAPDAPQVPDAPQAPTAAQPTASASAPPVADPSVIPFEDAPEINAALAEATPFNLAQAHECVWNPVFHRLPALDARGNAVEQFRSLRSRMQEFRDLNTLKSILISSALPQEGKSFVAANLAISFARHKNARVLLIDGDMRRSTLNKMFGCPEGPGLTEYLSGHATLADIVQRPVLNQPGQPVPLGLSSLYFIPGGHQSDRAADLSGNRRFDRLIEAVTPLFDWIVVDSSPVNLVADGANLARACDAVLLIARGGVTKYESAQRALTELKAAKVLGFVLNAVEDPPVASGYYGYDGYDKITE